MRKAKTYPYNQTSVVCRQALGHRRSGIPIAMVRHQPSIEELSSRVLLFSSHPDDEMVSLDAGHGITAEPTALLTTMPSGEILEWINFADV
jgi:hypothetical protein